ncbi:MAG: glycosyltransferase, partial [Magnetococcus sp. WYHC-3]
MTPVLLVAFHFPPASGASGVRRVLSLVRHLPDFGYAPVVLTAHPRAHERQSHEHLHDLPGCVPVCRAFALDSARHLSLAGKYPRILALPDRWMVWRWAALPAGLSLIRRHRPALIWSTCPIASTVALAADLQRRSGLPWVAEFRDPLVSDSYPEDPRVRRAYLALETRVARQARCVVGVTETMGTLWRQRQPGYPAAQWITLPNGYDEADFTLFQAGPPLPAPDQPLVLLHSGHLYPRSEHRNPAP